MSKNIVIVYSIENTQLYNRFIKHLKAFEYNNNLSFSYNSIIAEENNNLDITNSDIIFLLISVDFITSNLFKDNYFIDLLKEQTKKIIAILLEPCYWENTIIAKLNVKPDNKIPVIDKYWGNIENAFYHIIKETENYLIENQTFNSNFKTIQEESNNYPNTENSDYQEYKKTIKKADYLFSIEKWAEAIKLYREAIKYYSEGFEPDMDYVRHQIHICNEEILYLKNIETAKKAMEQNAYKTAVKYFKEALKYKYSEEIEEQYLKAKKLLDKTEKKNHLFKKVNTKEQSKNNSLNKNIILILSAIIILLLITSAIFYHNYTSIPQANEQTPSKKTNPTLDYKYFYKTLTLANYYTDNQQYKQAIKTLLEIDQTKLDEKQKKIFKYKLDSVYILTVNTLKIQIQDYLKNGNFNPEKHKYFLNYIIFLTSLQNIPEAKKIILYDLAHRLNNLYVNYYISYTNQLVKKHQYEKAKNILIYLRNNLTFPTNEQLNVINQKINKINKIEQLISQY